MKGRPFDKLRVSGNVFHQFGGLNRQGGGLWL